MVFTAKDYIEMIDMEINWCNNHPCTQYEYPEDNEIYKLAFIKGLEQAKYLINSTRILRQIENTDSWYLKMKG